MMTSLSWYSALSDHVMLLYLSWFITFPDTHQGIVRAIKDYQGPLKENEVTIFVRRGGPNYQEGLRVMEEVGKCFCFLFLEEKLIKGAVYTYY